MLVLAGVMFAGFSGSKGRQGPQQRPRPEQRHLDLVPQRHAQALGRPHHLDPPRDHRHRRQPPETDATVARLLQNQTDIGNAIKPYYGDAAGTQLTALLHDHIVIAAEIVTAAKTGDTAGVNDASARWYANGNDIAAFLNTANPQQWPLDHMQQMMREHLDLTLAEAVAHITGDFPADVAAYDRVHAAILNMADMLSLGIIDQFPKQFK